MKNLILTSLFLPFLSGCFLYDCGYTRNDDTDIYKTDSSNKMPISYSLKFGTSLPSGATAAPTEKSIRTKIEEVLKDTGLFSEVYYGDKGEKGYHIDFTYNDSGCKQEEVLARALLSVYTLLLIPIPEHISCDLSAVLYLEGKPIWSTAHTEKCRCIVWIGALPAGLVLNYWAVWRSIEYNLVCSTINDLTKEHIRRYLDPASVALANPSNRGKKVSDISHNE